MTYPTISVSLNEDRLEKLGDILRVLREDDNTVSRSEAIARAIDYWHPILCPSKRTAIQAKGQEQNP